MRKNIIMIVMDSIRADALSCYGNKRNTTPNIDELAARGMRYENAFSNSSWTLASIGSLFTGKYVSKHQACDENQFLNEKNRTIAEILSSKGYKTAAICDNAFVSFHTGLDRGFDYYNFMRFKDFSLSSKAIKIAQALKKRNPFGSGFYKDSTTVQFNEAKRWLKKNMSQESSSFLYIHSDQTHYPYMPPLKFRKLFCDRSRDQLFAVNQDREKYVGGITPMGEEDFAVLRSLYEAELAFFDHCLGNFIKWMHKNNMMDNVLLVVTADHGENLGEHGLIGHGLCLYDTVTKVPLVVFDNSIKKSGVVRTQVQLNDLFPTILNAAGIPHEEIPDDIDGSDLAGINEMEYHDRVVIAEHSMQSIKIFQDKVPGISPDFEKNFRRRLHMIRFQDHKFIWSSNGSHEFYDLNNDPQELINIYDSERDKADQYEKMLFEKVNEFDGAEQSRDELQDTDEEITKRLRELGYMA